MPSRLPVWSLALALCLASGLAGADAAHPDHTAASPEGEDLRQYVAGASRLEGRIMAPCCWNQTIDIHGSEPAYELRREIRRRLKAGETSGTIEASFVERYGAKILAVPESSPLVSVGNVMAFMFVGAGIGAFLMLKRWKRAGAASAASSKKKKGADGGADAKRDDLDDRLDRELSEIKHQV